MLRSPLYLKKTLLCLFSFFQTVLFKSHFPANLNFFKIDCFYLKPDLVKWDRQNECNKIQLQSKEAPSWVVWGSPPASRIGPGVLAARGGGVLICVYGVTKAACLHVKEDFLGKEKGVKGLWRSAGKATQASAFDRGRCICLWYSVVPGPAPPRPRPNPLLPAPHQPHIHSIRKQSVTFPTPYQSNLMLTSRASTFWTAPGRITIDVFTSLQK